MRHVVDKRDDFALREVAHIHAFAAEVQYCDDCKVEHRIRERIEQRRHRTYLYRGLRQGLRRFVEYGLFSLFRSERSDDSCARQVLFGEPRNVVEFRLNVLVLGHSGEHDYRKKNCNNKRSRNEYERQFKVDEHCHNDCSDCYKRRTQNKAYEHRNRLLRLVYVRCQTSDEGSGRKFVKFGVGKRVDVLVQISAQVRAESQ